MTLDIVLFSQDGSPRGQSSLTVRDHAALMELGSRYSLNLISRLTDYYSDTEYELAELQGLLDEITLLLDQCAEARLSEFLDDMKKLTQLAMRECTGLIVIAD